MQHLRSTTGPTCDWTTLAPLSRIQANAPRLRSNHWHVPCSNVQSAHCCSSRPLAQSGMKLLIDQGNDQTREVKLEWSLTTRMFEELLFHHHNRRLREMTVLYRSARTGRDGCANRPVQWNQEYQVEWICLRNRSKDKRCCFVLLRRLVYLLRNHQRSPVRRFHLESIDCLDQFAWSTVVWNSDRRVGFVNKQSIAMNPWGSNWMSRRHLIDIDTQAEFLSRDTKIGWPCCCGNSMLPRGSVRKEYSVLYPCWDSWCRCRVERFASTIDGTSRTHSCGPRASKRRDPVRSCMNRHRDIDRVKWKCHRWRYRLENLDRPHLRRWPREQRKRRL